MQTIIVVDDCPATVRGQGPPVGDRRPGGVHARAGQITKNGREYVVLVAAEDLESIEATLELLSDPEAQRRLTLASAEVLKGEVLAEDAVRDLPVPAASIKGGVSYRVVVARSAARQLAERLPEAVAAAMRGVHLRAWPATPTKSGAPLREPYKGCGGSRASIAMRYQIDDHDPDRVRPGYRPPQGCLPRLRSRPNKGHTTPVAECRLYKPAETSEPAKPSASWPVLRQPGQRHRAARHELPKGRERRRRRWGRTGSSASGHERGRVVVQVRHKAGQGGGRGPQPA